MERRSNQRDEYINELQWTDRVYIGTVIGIALSLWIVGIYKLFT